MGVHVLPHHHQQASVRQTQDRRFIVLESVLLGPKAGDWPGLSPVEGMEHLQAKGARKPSQEMCRGNQPVVIADGKHPVGAESFDLGQVRFSPGIPSSSLNDTKVW